MGSMAAAAAAVGLFLWGGLLLSDWLRDRERASSAAPRATPASSATAEVEVEPDIRMEAYLPDLVRFGPVKPQRFGKSRALFAAGPSKAPPEAVFGKILGALRRGLSPETAREALHAGPSARIALRLHLLTGRFEAGAFLVRMPPDLAAAKRGRLRLEPGGVVLAFPAGSHWEYVSFFFPAGLDLQELAASYAPPPDALAPLGPQALLFLEPALALGAQGGGPRTVLCRARGPAETAVDNTARMLEQGGWRRLHRDFVGEKEYVCVLRSARGEVWLATSARDAEGGFVTVLLAMS